MIDIIQTQPTQTVSSTIAVVMGAAILGSQLQPAQHREAYSVVQTSPSYSSFNASAQGLQAEDASFAEEISKRFAQLAATQESLGEDFQKAIFENLEDLYEV